MAADAGALRTRSAIGVFKADAAPLELMEARAMFSSLASLAVAVAISAPAESLIYTGSWNTTNRRLEGTMTCILTPLPHQQWEGRFYGVWQGVDFDYTVSFSGPASDLHGTATIDGASYEWRGSLDQKRFVANFSGDRYVGSFELNRSNGGGSTQGAEAPR
jgi:hypothetical protein